VVVPTIDRTQPKLTLTGVPATLKLKTFLKGVAGKASTDEPATLKFELRATPRKVVSLARFELLLGSRTLGLAGGTRSFTVKPGKRLVGKAKKLTVQLRVTATDTAGNVTAVTRTIKVQ
jgi:hypothetical protein